jgi:hypothetical protein
MRNAKCEIKTLESILMKSNRYNLIGIGITLFLLTQLVHAVGISSKITSLGSNTYRIEYTVINDGSLGVNIPIKLFDIGFDKAKYLETSLKVVTSTPLNTQWTETILASVFGDSAAYSSFASTTGILPGQRASGFAVEFEWIGVGTPNVNIQPFQVYDSNTFAQLTQGATKAKTQPKNVASIPTLTEWGMILLMVLMVVLAYSEIRKDNKLT